MGDNQGDLGFKPPHPGEYLREDILPDLKMTVGQLAKHLGVTRQTASRLVNEKAAVSTNMAIRLGQTFQNGARFWLALQMQFDLWEEQRDFKANIVPLDWTRDQAAG